MYYLREKVDVETFRKYVEILIYKNKKCKVTGKDEVLASLRTTFASRQYLKRLSGANVNWLQLDPQAATFAILVFLEETL